MERDDSHWTLLARYLADECDADERAAVERWLAGDPAHARELDDLRRWWAASGALPTASRVDGMWTALAARIHAAEPGRHAPLPTATDAPARRATPARTPVLTLVPRADRGARPRPWYLRAAGAAAAVALVSALGAGLWHGWQAGSRVAPAPAARVFATARGQRATVRLADGTRVELGFSSTLRVRPFTSGRRELYLEGEAVFDVVHDPLRPFLVHAAGAVTEDLGTRFGIRAYPGDEVLRVVVVSGSVAVEPRAGSSGSPRERAVLRPGQAGRVDGSGHIEVTSDADTTAYLSWLAGGFTFRSAPLAAVAAELERRFDVPITIPDSAAAARRVTVDMPGGSLDDVLGAVTLPLGLRWRRTAGGVVVER